MKALYDDMINQLTVKVGELADLINQQMSTDVEFILRNNITPPIKGDITKSKLKWRGINSIVFDCNHEFVGIRQRNELIDINGKRIKL